MQDPPNSGISVAALTCAGVFPVAAGEHRAGYRRPAVAQCQRRRAGTRARVRTAGGRRFSPCCALCKTRQPLLRSLPWCTAAGIGPAARQFQRIRQSNGGGMGNDGIGLNTPNTAAYLDLSPRMPDGYRVSGEGPAFHRFGNRVRYRRSDLALWAAGRRATTTAEADRLGGAWATLSEWRSAALICQGARGTSCVAGSVPSSIRRLRVWLVVRNSFAASVMVCQSPCLSAYGGSGSHAAAVAGV